MNKIGQVLICSPTEITVSIDDLETFEKNKVNLQIGRYLQIAQGNNDFVIAVIRNVRGDMFTTGDEAVPGWKFSLSCQALGNICNEVFQRGTVLLPVPTENVFVPDQEVLDKLFAGGEAYDFPFGQLSVNKDVTLKVSGDRFFSKHIAVVGSTGSGKSCTVARILHEAVGIADKKNRHAAEQKNAHVVIFDVHDEYAAAFTLEEAEEFTLNTLGIESLKLPYWLMNSEELESMFIESNEQNSHNQVSQFKQAVILNKEKHNPGLANVNYDTPVYFSLREVCNYIANLNAEVISRKEGENAPKLLDGTVIGERKEHYFESVLSFVPWAGSGAAKATNGPFNGEFDRFISRLEARLSDRRLKFLLEPKKADGSEFATADFDEIMKQFIGYLTKSNVTIVDLSGIPFEVLSITVSLMSRLIFDFCFHYSKLRHVNEQTNDIPVLIVCEEAHNYVPQNDSSAYRSSRKSLERIAKEGRKYGLGLMVVSQRPSEVSETIFAQCNNFVALRLTNDADQAYVRRLFPDNSNGITDILPNLAPGECIVVGDAVLLPAVVQMPLPSPEPHSRSVAVHKEWQENWRDITFEDVITRWRGKADGGVAKT